MRGDEIFERARAAPRRSLRRREEPGGASSRRPPKDLAPEARHGRVTANQGRMRGLPRRPAAADRAGSFRSQLMADTLQMAGNPARYCDLASPPASKTTAVSIERGALLATAGVPRE